MKKPKIILYKRSRLPIGTKNKNSDYLLRLKSGEYRQYYLQYDSDYIQPKGKFEKRFANKKVRKAECISGNYYKKLYQHFEWN